MTGIWILTLVMGLLLGAVMGFLVARPTSGPGPQSSGRR